MLFFKETIPAKFYLVWLSERVQRRRLQHEKETENRGSLGLLPVELKRYRSESPPNQVE